MLNVNRNLQFWPTKIHASQLKFKRLFENAKPDIRPSFMKIEVFQLLKSSGLIEIIPLRAECEIVIN